MTDKNDFINPISDQPLQAFGESNSTQQRVKSSRLEEIMTAKDNISVAEPSSPTHPQYPYNHARQTLSGHLIEEDDTPGAERLMRMHKSGTFEEIHPDGTRVSKIYGDDFYIVLVDHTLFVGGNLNISVQGNANLLVKGDMTTKVGGDYNLVVHGDMTTRVSGQTLLVSEQDMTLQGLENINQLASQKVNVKAKSDLTLQSSTNASLVGTSKATVWSDGTASINGTASRANSAPLGSGGTINSKPAAVSVNMKDPGAGLNIPDSITTPSLDVLFINKADNPDLLQLRKENLTYPEDREPA